MTFTTILNTNRKFKRSHPCRLSEIKHSTLNQLVSVTTVDGLRAVIIPKELHTVLKSVYFDFALLCNLYNVDIVLTKNTGRINLFYIPTCGTNSHLLRAFKAKAFSLEDSSFTDLLTNIYGKAVPKLLTYSGDYLSVTYTLPKYEAYKDNCFIQDPLKYREKGELTCL